MDLLGSREVARIAIQMSLTKNRAEENYHKEEYLRTGIRTVAIDYGGDFITSVNKIIERAVVASKREGVIGTPHAEEGAVAGAQGKQLPRLCQKPWD